MIDRRYLPPCPGGRWAVSSVINGVRLDLIQDSPLDDHAHVVIILQALGIEASGRNINRFFPNGKIDGRRRPTLRLLERFARLTPVRQEHGV